MSAGASVLSLQNPEIPPARWGEDVRPPCTRRNGCDLEAIVVRSKRPNLREILYGPPKVVEQVPLLDHGSPNGGFGNVDTDAVLARYRPGKAEVRAAIWQGIQDEFKARSSTLEPWQTEGERGPIVPSSN